MLKKTIKLVDLPDDKGIHIRIAGAKREKYVYIYFKHYRDEKGKVRHEGLLLGKYDETTKKMIPNKNYFEYMGLSIESNIKYFDYGFSYLISKVAEELNLLSLLTEVFGRRANEILVIIGYMIKVGNAMDNITEWQERNYFENCKILTSQITSGLFSAITEENRDKFFKAWIKEKVESFNICYDVTSISSYSEKMDFVERGYNRDNDNLAQINLGMFCRETDMLPLYYNRKFTKYTQLNNYHLNWDT